MTDVDTTSQLPAVQTAAPSGGGLLANPERFEFGWRAASLFAASQLVPPHLRGKKEDCFIAIHMAERLNEDPLIVLQNIHVVSGRAGWSAQYMIGRANRSGVFQGRINWRVSGKGDDLSVVAFAKLAETGEVVESPAVDMKMAKAEGWTKNAKYQSMPEVMLRYRAATFLIRFNCPEVMLGIPTAEELADMRSAGAARSPGDEGYEMVDGGELITAEADPFEQAAAGAAPTDQPTAAPVTTNKPSAVAASGPKGAPPVTTSDDDDEWADVAPEEWPEHVHRLVGLLDAVKSGAELDVLLAAPKFAAYHAAARHAPRARAAVDEEIARKRKELGA
ncbi:hypothetical protein [Inquilinus sp.]|uniref:hypothetical protein n=1 Tax=Inquilinus sp. TaxID=1932117 RepID=UPI0031D26FA9